MNRLSPINLENAQGKAKELLSAANEKLGAVPNIFKSMVNSPAVLDAYFAFSGALANGSLDAKVREQIALLVGQINDCQYCLAAHTAIGKGAGLNDEEINSARKGSAADAKVAAILAFARKVVESKANVSDADVDAAKAAGLSDGEVAEVVANVALNLFTNYFNHVNQTEIDFPKVAPLS